jgi:hypothetical protein
MNVNVPFDIRFTGDPSRGVETSDRLERTDSALRSQPGGTDEISASPGCGVVRTSP